MHTDWTHVPVDYGDVLRRAMDSLFKTFENLSEGTFIVDKNARVVWINKRYAARFGFSDPQEVIGRDCESTIANPWSSRVCR
jgi:PAS domain-containing protein